MNILQIRAQKLALLRAHFDNSGAIEVDTPQLRHFTVTDPYMNAMQVVCNEQKFLGYLQTSPEYAMKILLSYHSGDIYQLGKVFRANENSNAHACEFTMLEWYRLGWNYQQLMEEVKTVIGLVTNINHSTELTYKQAFIRYLRIDPFKIKMNELRQFAINQLGELPDNMLKDDYLSLLFASKIEPEFNPKLITFVTQFPASQASLAEKKWVNENHVALRFEAYCGGLELANGFEELTDVKEQLLRFEQDNQIRQQLGYTTQSIDPDFISALESGLPHCSGVAVGFDRLLMLATQSENIRQVLPMSFKG